MPRFGSSGLSMRAKHLEGCTQGQTTKTDLWSNILIQMPNQVSYHI